MIVATFTATNQQGAVSTTVKGETWPELAKALFLQETNSSEIRAVMDPQSGQFWGTPRKWELADVRVDHSDGAESLDAHMNRLRQQAAEGDKDALSQLQGIERRMGVASPCGWRITADGRLLAIHAVVRGADKGEAIINALPYIIQSVAESVVPVGKRFGVESLKNLVSYVTAYPIYAPHELLCVRCQCRDRQVMTDQCVPCQMEESDELADNEREG